MTINEIEELRAKCQALERENKSLKEQIENK